jgi:hypothetical protein
MFPSGPSFAEKQKTGSVPRTPGTPLDAPKPQRIQEVISYLSFFKENPDALKEGSPGELSQFFSGLVQQLQAHTQEEEAATRVIPREWNKNRDLKEVARQLVESANHAAAFKTLPVQHLSSLLSAWGTTIIPWVDDAVAIDTSFLSSDGSYIRPERLAGRLRDIVKKVLERPGRALRVLADASDSLTQWATVRADEDSTPTELATVEKLRAKTSAKELYTEYVTRVQADRPRTPSPFPEFDQRFPATINPSLISQLSGDTELEPRPRTPEPGTSRSEVVQLPKSGAPGVTLRQPTFPTPRTTRESTADTELIIEPKKLGAAHGKRPVSPGASQTGQAYEKAARTTEQGIAPISVPGQPAALTGTRPPPGLGRIVHQAAAIDRQKLRELSDKAKREAKPRQ